MKHLIVKAVLGIGLCVSAAHAGPPTTGDYVAREAKSWSLDLVNKSMNMHTLLMCILNKLRPELNVGGEPYKAKVDYTACQPGSVKGLDDVWRVYHVKVEATTGGYLTSFWNMATEQSSVLTNNTNIGFGQLFVSNLSSGDFTLNTCTAPDLTSTCLDSAYMKKSGESLQISLRKKIGSSLGIYSFVSANLGTTHGFGSFKLYYATNSTNQSKLDLDYAYEGDQTILNIIEAKSGNPTTGFSDDYPPGARCVDRNQANAKRTVYNYEIFNADGSLYEMPYPQVPYVITNARGEPLKDSSNNDIFGRLMWDVQSNQQGWALSVDKSVIVNRLNAGETLKARSNLAGVDNFELGIVLNSTDLFEPGFSLVSADGQLYRESPALAINLSVADGINVDGLLDSSLNGSTQNLAYMGNGYIWNIPWDSTNGDGYQIKDGTEVIGATDGKKYYVRPMFYSLEPATINCPAGSANWLAETATTRAALPSAPTFADALTQPWSDPRQAMGEPPELTSPIKYLHGVAQ